MRATRATAAILVIAALLACKKKKEEQAPVPSASASAPSTEIDAGAPPTPSASAEVDAALPPHPLQTVFEGHGGRAAHAGLAGYANQGGAHAGSVPAAKVVACMNACEKKFLTSFAAAKDETAKQKSRKDRLACEKACPGQ